MECTVHGLEFLWGRFYALCGDVWFTESLRVTLEMGVGFLMCVKPSGILTVHDYQQFYARQITLISVDSYLIERLTFPCVLLLQSINRGVFE